MLAIGQRRLGAHGTCGLNNPWHRTCGRCHNWVGIPGRPPNVIPCGSAGSEKRLSPVIKCWAFFVYFWTPHFHKQRKMKFKKITIFVILLTHKELHSEVFGDFKPSLTFFAGPVPRVDQTTGFVQPLAYTPQLPTLDQPRARVKSSFSALLGGSNIGISWNCMNKTLCPFRVFREECVCCDITILY